MKHKSRPRLYFRTFRIYKSYEIMKYFNLGYYVEWSLLNLELIIKKDHRSLIMYVQQALTGETFLKDCKKMKMKRLWEKVNRTFVELI